jgi:hypothetical protein
MLRDISKSLAQLGIASVGATACHENLAPCCVPDRHRDRIALRQMADLANRGAGGILPGIVLAVRPLSADDACHRGDLLGTDEKMKTSGTSVNR